MRPLCYLRSHRSGASSRAGCTSCHAACRFVRLPGLLQHLEETLVRGA